MNTFAVMMIDDDSLYFTMLTEVGRNERFILRINKWVTEGAMAQSLLDRFLRPPVSVPFVEAAEYEEYEEILKRHKAVIKLREAKAAVEG